MKKTITTIITFLILLTLAGCEYHDHGYDHSYHDEVVVTDSYHHDDYYYDDYYHEDYCYELPFDYCCAYYDYYDRPFFKNGYEVCKVTECVDNHTQEWHFEGEECWYE